MPLVYLVRDPDDDGWAPIVVKTKQKAGAEIRKVSPTFRGAMVVDLLRVKNDVDTIIALANGGELQGEVVARWRGKARGGLLPVSTGESE